MPIGGGREIGANSYLISANGHDILLDCGVHPKKDGPGSLPDLSLLRHSPDAVILSHGHVDHCGGLPSLMKAHPSTGLFATRATLSVMDRMLHNSVSVMTTLARERHIEGYPLYSHADVDQTMKRAWGMELDETFSVLGNGAVTARFRHAGHVLGSASVVLDLGGHCLFYTGDVCTTDQELLEGLAPHDDSFSVDTLVIESTYGANDHANDVVFEDEVERFCKGIARVLDRNGVALVPSFALGRTQEMLNIIGRLQDTGRLPDVPVFASGLGRAIYEVYNRYQHWLKPDASLRPLARFGRIGDVWNRSVTQELLLTPSIIVATSGMMIEDTPSALIAEELVRESRHGIFFVGYLDPDTLGYKLLHSEQGARLSFGRERPPTKVTLDDISWYHFGSHAPRESLQSLIESLRPKNVIFVHGDPEAIDWMQEETGEGYQCYSASQGQAIHIEI